MLEPLPLPLLITGVAGVAGYNALNYFHAKHPGRVIGMRQQDNALLDGPHVVACNAEDATGLRRLFDEHQFQGVLNCAGNCALRACEVAPHTAWRINRDGVQNLLDAIGRRDVRLVHLSIDLVFSGRKGGGYVETDPPDPVTQYGASMAAAEQLILRRRPDAAILRISLPMGVSLNGHAGAIDWIQSRFAKRRPATLYFDEVRTPTYTDCLNEVCEEVLRRPELRGLYHAGGPRALSLYQIAQVVNRVGGYDPDDLLGCWRYEAGPTPPRAGNVAMNSDQLAAALGRPPLTPWPLREQDAPTSPFWHYGRGVACSGRGELERVLYKRPGEGGATMNLV